MASPRNFLGTAHFERRARERGITVGQAMEVVIAPDKKRQKCRGEKGGFVYEFRRKLGDVELCIIAEVKKEDCWLMTGYPVE